MKKPPTKLGIALGATGAAFALYVMGAVLLIVDSTTLRLYDQAPAQVQNFIKFAYEPFFTISDRIFE